MGAEIIRISLEWEEKDRQGAIATMVEPTNMDRRRGGSKDDRSDDRGPQDTNVLRG